MKRSIVGSSLIILASSAVLAQTPETKLSFEAASLKPSEHPNVGNQIRRMMAGGPGTPDPGMYRYENVTLKMLVEQAYNLKEFQVTGPDWIDTAEYDLNAKIPRGTTADQAAQMMQTLLAERFHLAFHRETKPMQVYTVTVAKGGSKMKEAELPTVLPNPNGPPPGAGRGGRGPGVRMMASSDGMQLAGPVTMTMLTNILTRQLAHPVLDETELKGTYDVDISWAPEELDRRGGGGGGAVSAGPGGDSPPRASAPGLSLSQALEEKLGLKLSARKSDAEILIVDRADKVPVEN